MAATAASSSRVAALGRRWRDTHYWSRWCEVAVQWQIFQICRCQGSRACLTGHVVLLTITHESVDVVWDGKMAGESCDLGRRWRHYFDGADVVAVLVYLPLMLLY